MLKQLAERLTQEYGNGFSYSSLTRMVKFYTILPDKGIVATLSQQLSWSHHIGEYWLKLPFKELLQAKLHKAMIEARTRLELRRQGDGDA